MIHDLKILYVSDYDSWFYFCWTLWYVSIVVSCKLCVLYWIVFVMLKVTGHQGDYQRRDPIMCGAQIQLRVARRSALIWCWFFLHIIFRPEFRSISQHNSHAGWQSSSDWDYYILHEWNMNHELNEWFIIRFIIRINDSDDMTYVTYGQTHRGLLFTIRQWRLWRLSPVVCNALAKHSLCSFYLKTFHELVPSQTVTRNLVCLVGKHCRHWNQTIGTLNI